jgi:menaquinone-dependent protoporphyrinogen oxidase
MEDRTMRVLVSAASRHGATTEIAARIADGLGQAGIEAVVVEPDAVNSLEGFDGVVLGSGVYAGRWLEPAKKLVERHADGLRVRPVWLFSSGPVGNPPKPEAEPPDVGPLRAATMAREHRIIPGKLDKGGLSFAERAISRVVGAAEGDFRPWVEIDAWARTIAEQLAPRAH